jgi:hypothetical protein
MIDLLTYMDSVLMPIHVDPLMWFLPRSESCDTVVQVMDEQLKWTLLIKYITYISVKINSLENIGVTQYVSYPITPILLPRSGDTVPVLSRTQLNSAPQMFKKIMHVCEEVSA